MRSLARLRRLPAWPGGDGLGGRRGLLAVVIGIPVAEYAVLEATAIPSGPPLAPQVTALSPFGVLHDLRFLLVFHRGWWTFAAMAIAMLALRTALVPLIVRLAWPADVPWPGRRRALGGGAAYAAIATLLLAPAATILFLNALVPLWWLMATAAAFAAIPVLLLHQVAHPVGWWRHPPPLRLVGWVLLEGAVLTLAALAVSASPPGVGVLPVAGAGLFGALAWKAAAEVVARRWTGAPAPEGHRQPPLWVPAAAIGGAVVAAGIGFGIAALVNPVPSPQQRVATRAVPVVVAEGFRSTLTRREIRDAVTDPRLPYRPFSYRGLAPDGRPLPYGPRATYQSLEHLADLMDRQVRALARERGEPIALVGESEGSLLVRYYLLTRPHPPVSREILLSPILAPGGAVYPPPGRDGPGVASRFAVWGVAKLISATVFGVDPDIPFLRSLNRNAALLREGAACGRRLPAESALVPLSAAVAQPAEQEGMPRAVVPAVHGSVADGARARAAVIAALHRTEVPRSSRWEVTADVIRGAASAWRAPRLPIGLLPGAPPPGCPG